MPHSRSARTAAVFTVGALSVFGLAACGSSSGEADEVTLEYMHRLPDREGMASVDSIVQRGHEDDPDVQVKATKFDGEARDMILNPETVSQADNAPCLAQLGYAEVPQLYAKVVLQDVSEGAAKYEDTFSSGA